MCAKPQELFEEFKSWWKSKTIIGVIIASVSSVAAILGYDLSGLFTEVSTGAEDIVAQADIVWVSVQNLIGAAIAFWGRIKAKTQLVFGKKPS